jgi:2-dehydro-3-deoxyphosphogluconate aldolase/(4S)-4-hydroxy-2-oxoglutarate aldolase
MEQKELMEQLRRLAVVPVIAIESAGDALPMADALVAGGLPIAEITFRTAAGAEVIKKLKKERPSLMLGAGTILTVEQLAQAKECGAVFGVTPGFNPQVVKKSIEIKFPLFPGVLTPSEIEQGLSFGLKVLKFFPSEAAGGVNMLKAVSAPYGHLGVKFVPTGGVSLKNLADYLALSQVIAVGGTWIATKDTISAKKWGDIEKNAADVVQAVKKIRG